MTEQLVERPAASIDVDAQHGPLVSVTINGHTVSVYLMGESAVYTDRDTRQAGMEVTGPWFKFREAIALLSPVEDGEVKDVAEEIDVALHACDDHIHGYDYHVYSLLHEALGNAADLIARQQRTIQNFEKAGWRCCIDHLLKPEHPCPICKLERAEKQRDEALSIVANVGFTEDYDRIQAMGESDES